MYDLEKSRKWNHFVSDTKLSRDKGIILKDGIEYYLTSEGVIANGFQTVNGRMYYFDEEGAMVKGEWREIKNEWYYFKDNGTVTTDYLTLAGRDYHFDAVGRMSKGFSKIDNETYKYFHPEKGYALHGWIVDDGKIMFADELGRLVRGRLIRGMEVFYIEDNFVLRVKGVTPCGEHIDANGRVICKL